MKDCEVWKLNIRPDHVALSCYNSPQSIDFDVDGSFKGYECN